MLLGTDELVILRGSKFYGTWKWVNSVTGDAEDFAGLTARVKIKNIHEDFSDVKNTWEVGTVIVEPLDIDGNAFKGRVDIVLEKEDTLKFSIPLFEEDKYGASDYYAVLEITLNTGEVILQAKVKVVESLEAETLNILIDERDEIIVIAGKLDEILLRQEEYIAARDNLIDVVIPTALLTYNDNHDEKTITYNNNHDEKVNAYDINSMAKTNEYNSNHDEKYLLVNALALDVSSSKNYIDIQVDYVDDQVTAVNNKTAEIVLLDSNIQGLKQSVDGSVLAIDFMEGQIADSVSQNAIIQSDINSKNGNIEALAIQVTNDKQDVSLMKNNVDNTKTIIDSNLTSYNEHLISTSNPHSVTAEQVNTYDKSTIDGKISLKANSANPTFTGTVTGVSKSMVGLGNADNTSDSNKPISTATQTALNTTVKLTGDQPVAGIKTFTSSPIVPVPTTNFQSVPLRSTNITVNVGAGQTYTTINQALEYLSGFYPMYKKSGVTATINLKAGFVMAEQVLVSGIDLGWITIVGEDAETIITHTALVTLFSGYFPAFGVNRGGTSPVIGQLFRFNVEKVGGYKHGLMTYDVGSSANVLSGAGFIGAGVNGIYVERGSTINAQGANCSNAGNNGIYANRSSTINAQGANCSNAGNNGIYAGAASTINANSANCSNAGNNGIYANQSSTINVENANCSNAGTNGIYAGTGSTINAFNAIIQNQTTGSARVRVFDGSQVEASGINTTGGTVAVFSQAVNTLTANGIIYQ